MNVSALTASSTSGGAAPRGESLRLAPPAEQRAAVAGQFEAILVRQLLGPTLTRVLGSEGGAAAGVYGDMLTDVIATKLTSAGGLGLGRLIAQQLTPRGQLAADAAPARIPL